MNESILEYVNLAADSLTLSNKKSRIYSVLDKIDNYYTFEYRFNNGDTPKKSNMTFDAKNFIFCGSDFKPVDDLGFTKGIQDTFNSLLRTKKLEML